MHPFRFYRPRLLPGRPTRVICWRDCGLRWKHQQPPSGSWRWVTSVLPEGETHQNKIIICSAKCWRFNTSCTLLVPFAFVTHESWPLSGEGRRSGTAAYLRRTNWPHDFARSSPPARVGCYPRKVKRSATGGRIWCQFSGVSEFFSLLWEKKRENLKVFFAKRVSLKKGS